MPSKIRGRIGIPGIVIIILAPLLTAILTVALTPHMVKNSVRAQMVVGMYPVVGTHAAYESSSYVADYMAAYTAPDAVSAAAKATAMDSGEAASMLSAQRLGDNTGDQTTFTARDEAGAQAGVRAASTAALRTVVEADKQRNQVKYDAARTSMTRLVAELDAGKVFGNGLKETDLATVRAESLREATQRLGQAATDLQASDASLAIVDNLVKDTPVETTRLTDRTAEIKTIAGATLAAFLFAVLFVFFLGGRRGRRRSGDTSPTAGTVTADVLPEISDAAASAPEQPVLHREHRTRPQPRRHVPVADGDTPRRTPVTGGAAPLPPSFS